MTDCLIIGAGVFGLATALELRDRGHNVTVLDPGPIPHPRAASTDLNKAVRMEYGDDALYRDLVDQAIDGWHAWNQRLGVELYQETGVLLLAGQPLDAGGYEGQSLQRVREAGHEPEHLVGSEITDRFGAWASDVYPEALFHARGGLARSGKTVEALARHAADAGVRLCPGQTAARLITSGGGGGGETSGDRTSGGGTSGGQTSGGGGGGGISGGGVVTREGETFCAEHTVVAAGAWTASLLPELRPYMKATAHPMFYLRPADPASYAPPRFCVFTADVARTGWYGFPVDAETGLLKIAKHDAGDEVDPNADRGNVSPHRHAELRTFLETSLPGLADAAVVEARHCLYTDTLDGHFWIDRHPSIAGLTVATGGSGHAMKAAPVLGPLIADVVEGKTHPWGDRFAWRTEPSAVPGDAARAEA